MTIILICFLISAVERCFLFHQRDIKWWKALIPGYNRYLLGKLSCCKKLGIIVGIILPILVGLVFGVYFFESWLITSHDLAWNGTTWVLLGVTKQTVFWLQFLQYALVGVAILGVSVWSWMMMKFSQMHKKSNWWIFIWAICPVIGYTNIVFGKQIGMYGKRYTIKKVEVHDKR